MDDPNILPWTGQLQPQLDAAMINTSVGSSNSDAHLTTLTDADSDELEEKPPCGYIPYEEIQAALHHFKTWPEKWVKEGKAPFIHPRLYTTTGMPRPLQDAYAACAIYSTKTDQNEFVAFTVIESKANDILHSPEQPDWTTMDLLAAVQALLIYQFIRLLDGDIRQRASAEKAEKTLQAWTEQLKATTAEAQAYTTSTAPSWQSWALGESIRRTITMSFFLRGAYSLKKEGFCTFGDDVSANSFTAQRRLWEARSPLEWERIKQAYNPHWVPKMDFDRVIQESTREELDDFGVVLMTTYKGQDVVDHWLATTQLKQHRVMETDLHRSLLRAI